MPTEHTLLLALFGLLALTVGLLALLIYLVLSDRHRRGAEDDDLCDALLEGVVLSGKLKGPWQRPMPDSLPGSRV